MSWQTELSSWMSPPSLSTAEPPKLGQRAPSHAKFRVPKDGKPTVITFLRHCGCPFAEKTFLQMRDAASKHRDISFIAVSHSEQISTDRWIEAVGGTGSITVVVDIDRETYAAWGLGTSSFWHVLSPSSLYSVYSLGNRESIWNRPTESGSRWQTSGAYGVDREGVVRFGGPAGSADEIPDFEEAVKAIRGGSL